jgi:uncharacterized protein with HEPN domain
LKRDIAVIVTEMCDAIWKAQHLIGTMTPKEFADDMRTHEAIYGVVLKYGEAAAVLQRDHGDLLKAYPDFPARSAIDMRNRLIHGYWSINFEILYDIAMKDLPETELTLRKILTGYPPPKDF